MKIYTIYKATNSHNGKVYIGFSKHWPKRINGHNYDRKYSDRKHKAFYRAIQKYGWESFVWEAIYQSKDFDHTLKIMEPYFIEEYRSWVGYEDCRGYNTTRGGEGTTGWKRSPELIERHRQLLTGRKQTPEHIESRRRVLKGRSNPTLMGENNPAKCPEVREKISQKTKGRPKTESHKQAMRSRPQDTVQLTCPHCNKTGDYKNLKRWHMNRCKMNPDRIADLDRMVTCDVCGYTAKESPNFYRNHNQHCKSKIQGGKS